MAADQHLQHSCYAVAIRLCLTLDALHVQGDDQEAQPALSQAQRDYLADLLDALAAAPSKVGQASIAHPQFVSCPAQPRKWPSLGVCWVWRNWCL